MQADSATQFRKEEMINSFSLQFGKRGVRSDNPGLSLISALGKNKGCL